MKIAIPITSQDINDNAAKTLGRSPYLLIYNHNTLDYKFIVNKGHTLDSHRAEAVITQLVKEDVDILLAPDIGDNAFNLLQEKDITVYRYPQNISARNALYDYYERDLPQLMVATIHNPKQNSMCTQE